MGESNLELHLFHCDYFLRDHGKYASSLSKPESTLANVYRHVEDYYKNKT